MELKLSKLSKQRKLGKKIAFEYYAPQAQQVSVAGTFNNWHPAEHLLKKDRKGNWKLALTLPPGRYEYRYRVDGSWQNEQRPTECAPNTFGTWNCIVVVQ